MNNELTLEEKKKIEKDLQKAACKCGHLKSSHSKFINGLFVGCQHPTCNCKKFDFSYDLLKGEE